MKSLPLSIKLLYYQRQLLFSGMQSISRRNKNQRGLDGKTVIKALSELEK